MVQYLVSYEYNGTFYSGWQAQPNEITIQSRLEEIFSIVLKEPCGVDSCGRTDRGVSALCHYCSFSTKNDVNIRAFIGYANFLLRNFNIVILGMRQVADNFNIRFDCTQRTYMYRILNRPYHSVLLNKLYHLVPNKLDLALMKDAAEIFIGTHDFNAFRAVGCQAFNSVRTIFSLEIKKENDIIEITISGNAFLYNMVRIIVSSLVLVGMKKLTKADLQEILKSKKRSNLIPTISSYGLFFLNAEFKTV